MSVFPFDTYENAPARTAPDIGPRALAVNPTPHRPKAKTPQRSADGLLRVVYDCRNGEDGQELVRGEGDPPTGDPAVDQAYENTGAAWRLFKECYGRDSIDDHGTPLVSFVHYRDGYNNANWNGEYMVYGDGSEGAGLHNLTEITITAHEITHGIVQETLNLDVRGEAGTLNEHLADVFGVLAKQYDLKQTADQADWLIGAGINRDPRKGEALRSLKDPKAISVHDEAPDHVDGYVHSLRSNYAVHINVGIPNKAFYLVAAKLGGHAYDDAGQIWYRTMTQANLRSNCRFHHFAQATITAATELYGEDSKQVQAVREAWTDVGVLLTSDQEKIAKVGLQEVAAPRRLRPGLGSATDVVVGRPTRVLRPAALSAFSSSHRRYDDRGQ